MLKIVLLFLFAVLVMTVGCHSHEHASGTVAQASLSQTPAADASRAPSTAVGNHEAPTVQVNTQWIRTFASVEKNRSSVSALWGMHEPGPMVDIRSDVSLGSTADGMVFLVGDHDGNILVSGEGNSQQFPLPAQLTGERGIFWGGITPDGTLLQLNGIASRDQAAGHVIRVAKDGSLFIGGRVGGELSVGRDLVSPKEVGDDVNRWQWENDRNAHPYKAKRIPLEMTDAPVLAKFGAGGQLAWVRLGYPSASGRAEVTAIAILSDNSVIAVGTYTMSLTFQAEQTFDGDQPHEPLAQLECSTWPSTGFPCVFMAKYDWDGRFLWAKKMATDLGRQRSQAGDPSPAAGPMRPRVVALSDDSFWITAQHNMADHTADGDAPKYSNDPTAAGTVAVLNRFDAAGQLMHAVQWPATGNVEITGATAVTGDALVVVGAFSGDMKFASANVKGLTAVGEDDGFVAKIDKTGRTLWADRDGGAHRDALLDVASMGKNGVLVVGGRNVRTLPENRNNSTVPPPVGVAIQYATDGRRVFAKQLQGKGSSVLASVTAFPDGTAVIAGMAAGEIQVDTHSFTAKGAQDVFVWKLSGFPFQSAEEGLEKPSAQPPCPTQLTKQNPDANLLVRGASVSEAAYFIAHNWRVNMLVVGDTDEPVYFDSTATNASAAFAQLAAASHLELVQRDRLFILGPAENIAHLSGASAPPPKKTGKHVDMILQQSEWQQLEKWFEHLAYPQSGAIDGHVTMLWRNTEMSEIQGLLLALAGASWTMTDNVVALNAPASLPVAPYSDRRQWRTPCDAAQALSDELSCVPVTDLEVIALSTAQKIPAALFRRRTRGLGYGMLQYAVRQNYVGQLPVHTYTKLNGRVYPLGKVHQINAEGVDLAFGWTNEETKHIERILLNTCP